AGGFALRFLKGITDINVRSNLTLFFVHNPPLEHKLYERLHAFEKSHRDAIYGVTRGLTDTLIIIRSDALPAMRKLFSGMHGRSQEKVSSITMKLPDASLPVPGVYYLILKALAWEGINLIELVSAGTELTVFVGDKDVERTLHVIRNISGGAH